MARSSPLASLRVLDFADEIGDLAGRLLADLGADVQRIEPPGGAPSRTFPPLADDGTSLWFAFRNMNKSGLELDLNADADVAAFLDLVGGADVLIDNGNLDADALLEQHPRLIICSVTPFGLTGPYSDFAATDEVVFSLSGNLSMSGVLTSDPLFMPGSVASDTAGVMAAYAICVALWQRKATGLGQHLDVSALEATAQLNTWGLSNTSSILNSGGDPSNSNTRNGTSPMYPNFATTDGQVRCVTMAPGQWFALYEWMGKPEGFEAEEWGQIFFRFMNLDVLNPVIAEHFAPLTMVEAAVEAQRRGVVATPMLTPSDLLANEHYESRATFTDIPTGAASATGAVTARVPSGFALIDGQRVGPTLPAPQLGTGQIPNWPTHRNTASAAADQSADTDTGTKQPLDGIRVLDFGHGGVGVEAGRMFAEYGADVIKIESRTYPDFIRIVLGSEMTPSFASSSRSKRGFGANLKNDRAREVLLALAKTAHVVIENNSTGTMDALGLGFEAFKAANPDIVMVSSQLMGGSGTYAHWSGYGPTIQTAGGLSWLWAFADGEGPPGTNAIHPDHLAGRVCSLVALASLLDGGGTHCEVAQVEALINTLGDIVAQESLRPGSAVPQGNDSDRGAPWGVFRCSGVGEQWCTITVKSDANWQALCELMQRDDLANDPSLATHAGRLADRARCNDAVSQWTSSIDRYEVMQRCQEVGIPAGTMLTSIDQLADPHFAQRGFLSTIVQPDHDPAELTLAGPAFRGSRMPEPVEERAPLIGEHTRQLCAELGIDDATVDALIADGVLEVTE